jgi:hypothetical protein
VYQLSLSPPLNRMAHPPLPPHKSRARVFTERERSFRQSRKTSHSTMPQTHTPVLSSRTREKETEREERERERERERDTLSWSISSCIPAEAQGLRLLCSPAFRLEVMGAASLSQLLSPVAMDIMEAVAKGRTDGVGSGVLTLPPPLPFSFILQVSHIHASLLFFFSRTHPFPRNESQGRPLSPEASTAAAVSDST